MRFKIDVRSLLPTILNAICVLFSQRSGCFFCPCPEKLYRLNLKFKTTRQSHRDLIVTDYSYAYQ